MADYSTRGTLPRTVPHIQGEGARVVGTLAAGLGYFARFLLMLGGMLFRLGGLAIVTTGLWLIHPPSALIFIGLVWTVIAFYNPGPSKDAK